MGLFNQRSEKNRVGSPPQYMTENISEELIRLEDLVKIYDTGALKVLGLKRINLTIHRGEFVAIIGHSGSGKSTLMNMLGCLDVPTSGSYFLHGHDVGSMSDDELSDIRNQGWNAAHMDVPPRLMLSFAHSRRSVFLVRFYHICPAKSIPLRAFVKNF